MTEVILVAHGRLATELKNSLNMIYGETPQFHAVEYLVGEGFDTVKDKLEAQLAQLGSNVLIMCDIFGGTPFNAACAVAMTHKDRAIEVIAGVSMPLALEAAVAIAGDDVESIAKSLVESSKEMVRRFEEPAASDDDDDDDL